MFCPLVLVSEQTHSMFSTTAQVRAVAGVGAQILTSVTIDSQVGHIPKSFDYHPPRVSSIVRNRLPTQSFLCAPLRKHHVFFICNVCSTACVLSILQIIPRHLLGVRVRRSLDIDGCCQRPRSVFAVGDVHSIRLNFMSKFNLSRLSRVSAFFPTANGCHADAAELQAPLVHTRRGARLFIEDAMCCINARQRNNVFSQFCCRETLRDTSHCLSHPHTLFLHW